MDDTKGGPFDIAGDLARDWLRLPANPNGRTNADVLNTWVNGRDLTRRPAGKWIVDFGLDMSATEGALYEQPFRWVQERVYPMRQKNRREAYRKYWWRHVEPRQGMWAALDGQSRYIATPTTTFPFPPGLTPDVPAAQHASNPHAMAVAQAAQHLVELPDRWLNPPERVEWIDEPVPGHPKRPVPRRACTRQELAESATS